MKHLIAKEHHQHLKKRALLEFVGLILLVTLSINQRDLIVNAISAIRDSDVLLLLLLLSVYWLMLPLTALSYRLLSYKKIPLGTTMLAQLAAAGPGRIIPGGLGHISIGSVHLQKLGLKLQKAIVVTVANNLIGLSVNFIMVVAAIIYHPNLLERVMDNISAQFLIVLTVLIIAIITALQWLSHAHSTRSTIKKVNKHWKSLISLLISNPHRLVSLAGIAALITLGNVTMLLLAGEALHMHIQPSDALLALSAGVLIGGAVPTPGGLGAMEAGTASALIVLGYGSTEATSMVLLFRTATYWQPLLPGVAAYFYLRERKLL